MSHHCTKCKGPGPFPKVGKRSPGKFRSVCKKCVSAQNKIWRESNRNRHNALQRRWRKANPERHKENEKWQKVKRLYGITKEDYTTLLSSQAGVCAICREACDTRSRLSVDHDHETGYVRGLLCQNCNVGLAQFKDDPELLYTAIVYLTRAWVASGKVGT